MPLSVLGKTCASLAAALVLLTVPEAAVASYKVGGQGRLPFMRIDQVCRDGVKFMAASMPPGGSDPLARRTYIDQVRLSYLGPTGYVPLTPRQRLWLPHREVAAVREPQVTIDYLPPTLTHSKDVTLDFNRILDPSVSQVELSHKYPSASPFGFTLDVADCMLVDLEPRAEHPNTLAPEWQGSKVDFALLGTREFRAGGLDVASMRMTTSEVQTVRLGGAVGGTYTLTFRGATTSPLSVGATPEEVAYELGFAIGRGDVSVSRGAEGMDVAFTGRLAGTDVEPLVLDATGLVAPQSPPGVAETTPIASRGALSVRKRDVNHDGRTDVVGRFPVQGFVPCAPSQRTLGLRLTTETTDGRSYVGADEAQTACV